MNEINKKKIDSIMMVLDGVFKNHPAAKENAKSFATLLISSMENIPLDEVIEEKEKSDKKEEK